MSKTTITVTKELKDRIEAHNKANPNDKIKQSEVCRQALEDELDKKDAEIVTDTKQAQILNCNASGALELVTQHKPFNECETCRMVDDATCTRCVINWLNAPIGTAPERPQKLMIKFDMTISAERLDKFMEKFGRSQVFKKTSVENIQYFCEEAISEYLDDGIKEEDTEGMYHKK